MNGQDAFDRFLKRHPHPHKPFFERPHLSRRDFFALCGAGITVSCLTPPVFGGEVISSSAATTQNKAKNCIFIFLPGAPSHTDIWDLKYISGVTPAGFAPTMINGINWPQGLLPKIGAQLGNMAIIRSVRAWALVHTLAQTWAQIGRNPAAVLGDIAPHIGSVVAIEKEKERQPGQVFPTFLSLNSASMPLNGYFSAQYAPFKINPSAGGIPNTTNPDGQARVDARLAELASLDGKLRVNSPYSKQMEDMDNFYKAARGLMYNATVNQAFGFSTADSLRYGSLNAAGTAVATGFGNACLVAKQVLQANGGTRFIQITQGGWDMHSNIYQANNLNPASPANLGAILDNAVGTLLADLSSSGMLNDTLVVIMGEFGRTVGNLTAGQGRDHYPQMSVVFAGAGIRGGRAIGATNDTGSITSDPGWSAQRDVRPEDIEATIYSALGIDWTTVRYDDPFKRGFEYVPFANQGVYQPVNELWA